MYEKIKQALAYLAEVDVFWRVCNATIIPVAFHISNARGRTQRNEVLRIAEDSLRKDISTISPILEVLNGPFKGLKYPSFKAIGSAFSPKIIGSYESELHETISIALEKNYSTIVDIGCAEGYYAVGFAKALKDVQVYAYDIDNDALELARQMAELNDVSSRLHLDKTCSPNTLLNMEFDSKALIICDCEGYEAELFNDEVVAALRNQDFLIETHDFLNIEISEKLKHRFSQSHNITSIYSIDDITKAHTYEYPELKDFSLQQRFELLKEQRPVIMEWLYITAK